MSMLIVGCGGFLGSVTRYGVGRLIAGPGGFPLATLLINLLGCLAIGAMAAAVGRAPERATLALFVMTGFLGGFTTFSAFGLDNLRLIEGGRLGWALANVVIQVVGGVLAAWAGHSLLSGSPSP